MKASHLKPSPLALLLGLGLLIGMSSCNYYKRIPVEPAQLQSWESELTEMGRQRGPMIHLIHGDQHFQLTDYSVSGTLIQGTLAETQSFALPANTHFRMGVIPRESRKTLVRSLYVSVDSPLQEGPFSMQAEDGTLFLYRDAPFATFGSFISIPVGMVIAGGAFLAIACSCPHVYAVDSAGNQHPQGSLLSGAIAESFEREDLLPLHHVEPIGSEIALRVANELPEDEHLNELALLAYSPTNGYELGLDAKEGLFEFRSGIAPLTATDNQGTEVWEQLTQRDDVLYRFDNQTPAGELSTVNLSFDRSQFSTAHAKLLIYGRQTDWLIQAADAYFQLKGTDFDKMNRNMNRVPRWLYDRNMSRQGISLNAYLNTTKGWKKIGVFKNVGATMPKLLGLDVPLDQVTGETIEIKLASGFQFWELDQVAMTTDWLAVDDLRELPLLSAVNQNGEDVHQLISATDQQYLVQPSAGTYVDLRFAAAQNPNERYVLRGSGYYYHRRSYTNPPQKQLVKAIRSRGKMAAHEFSELLHLYLQGMATSETE